MAIKRINKHGFSLTFPQVKVNYSNRNGENTWKASLADGSGEFRWGLNAEDSAYLLSDLKEERLEDIARAVGHYAGIFANDKGCLDKFKALTGNDQFFLLAYSGCYHNLLLQDGDTSWLDKLDMSDDLRMWFNAFKKAFFVTKNQVMFAPCFFMLRELKD